MCKMRGTCLHKKTSRRVVPHSEFMSRIGKSLYYGPEKYQKMAASGPLAGYTSELFSEVHRGYSLHRLDKTTVGKIDCHPSSLIMALIYLERLQASDPNFVRSVIPSHLFLVAVMVSTKVQCDGDICMTDWALEPELTNAHIKKMELEFLDAVEWNVHVSTEEFFNKLHEVEKVLAEREGLRRGWLTYTELQNLLPSFTLAKFILSNIAVMAICYAASVMTIAGAFFLANQVTSNCLQVRYSIQNSPTTTENSTSACNLSMVSELDKQENLGNELDLLNMEVVLMNEKNISSNKYSSSDLNNLCSMSIHTNNCSRTESDMVRNDNNWLWYFSQKNLQNRVMWLKII